jgi:hypothetical protein
MALRIKKSGNDLTYHDKSLASGVNGFLNNAWPVCRIVQGRGGPVIFPPEIVMEVKALACELPGERNLPFSRFSHAEIAREAVRSGIVASISGATVWRWLSADAIKPWTYRSWIFPRDPEFAGKAAQVLDLYQGMWNGKRLAPNDYVISADEKTSIQARNRNDRSTAPGPNRCRRVEFEYERAGSLAYLAAWDVRRAKVFGLCENTTGIEAFHRLVDLVPVHASWLNQIEIYFSVVQRKVLTPNDVPDLATLERRLLEFQSHYERIAKPFKWKFTRDDLNRILSDISYDSLQTERVAA